MKNAPEGFVVLGHISRAHGVHGAVIIHPYTADPELILEKAKLLELLAPDGLTRRPVPSIKGKVAAQGVIVKIQGISDRNEAQDMAGWRVGINREHLPPPAEDEIYLADLIGLEVFTPDQTSLGKVVGIVETGSCPLLATVNPAKPKEEILLPFHEDFIVSLDSIACKLVLDLPPGLLE